jgi:hypothetical protein
MSGHDPIRNMREYKERAKHQVSTQWGSVCVLVILAVFAVLVRLEK